MPDDRWSHEKSAGADLAAITGDVAGAIFDSVVPFGSLGRVGVSYIMAKVGGARADKAFETVIAAVAEVSGSTPEEAGEEVRRLLKDAGKETEDRLYQTFRSMLSSRTDATWPYMARLAALHLRSGEPAGIFERRCGWLLDRCGPEDIDLLVELMRRTWESVIGLDPGRHYGVVWSLEQDLVQPSRVSAHPLLFGDLPDTNIGGEVAGAREHEADDLHALLVESRLIGWRKQGRLAMRAGDDTLVRLVELFTGPLDLAAIERLKAVKVR